ncbi:MAG TPA: FAD-dependent oxidoreductase [Pyrinomonadaceae bacterium]
MGDDLTGAAVPTPAGADVLILGGGPAGAATACTLASAGASVVLVERSSYESVRVGETFPPVIARALARLQLSEFIDEALHVPSYGVRSLWGGDEPHERSFVFDAYGHGWHVDRRAFDAALAFAAEQRGVRVLRQTRLISCERDAGAGWKIRMAAPGSVVETRARFVVDATGRASALARRLGGSRVACDQLVGVYRYYSPAPRGAADATHDAFTLIEADERGWWYSAPLPAGRFVVAFMTDADLCQRDGRRRPEQPPFAPRTRERATRYAPEGECRLVSANNSRAEPVSGRDWLAVGDAAVAFDPLSGDGVLRALEWGPRAARAVLRAIDGDTSELEEYAGRLRDEWEVYRDRQRAFYARETRWPASTFWARRREPRRS